MTTARVLLADDHDLVRAGIRNALHDVPGLTIVGEADDGPSLLAALARLQPDLLIADVAMPAFDPLSAMRQIRARHPDLRILVVSAHDDDLYVQGLLQAGINGYHLKDQPLTELRLAVNRVLSGKRWLSSPLLDKLLQPSPLSTEPRTTRISPRQIDILRLLVAGLDNRALALRLGVSVKTVETHLTRLYRQIGVQSRLEAVHYAHHHPDILAGEGVRGEAEISADSAISPPGPQAILVVDDSTRYRRQMGRMIQRVAPEWGLFSAENSAAALRLAHQQRPVLAFVDVVLGNESGIDCTRRLRQALPTLRVVLMSAYPDREFRRQGLQAGACAFIDKRDLTADSLQQIISDSG
jgi:DNA-binding NarL/FixJ family response regulator